MRDYVQEINVRRKFAEICRVLYIVAARYTAVIAKIGFEMWALTKGERY
jgi:hypothetical protein